MKDPGQSGVIQRLLIVHIDIGGGAITIVTIIFGQFLNALCFALLK